MEWIFRAYALSARKLESIHNEWSTVHFIEINVILSLRRNTMGKLKGTRTEKNLLGAFAGESQARNRYSYFASKARKEGLIQIADIFEETANQEKEHAKRFFKFLEGGEVEITASFPAGMIGTTAENLLASAGGEHHEHTVLYPVFAAIAREE